MIAIDTKNRLCSRNNPSSGHPKKGTATVKPVAKNRKATFEYAIEEKFEAGIVLRGPEVKSLRTTHPSLAESYAFVKNGEVWLVGLHISTIAHASYMNHPERRDRKLLLHSREIKKLDTATRQKGYTIIPLELYFNEDNRLKVEIALAKGKATHDKRESSKATEAKREMAKALKRKQR